MLKPIFGELFIDHAEAGRNIIHLFISQPTPLEEKSLGRVFILIEFDQVIDQSETILQRIDDTFTDAFYHSADFETEAAFERALQKVNRAVQDLVSQFGEDWTYHTNAILGVFQGTQLYLTNIGKVEGKLVHDDNITTVIELQATTEIKPLKLFTNIVSGKCPEKSGLLFSTSNLLDYLSLEKIKRTVQANTPAEATEYLSSTLSEHDTLSNIAGFVVKFTSSGNQETPVTPYTNTNDEALDHTEFTEPVDSMSKLIHQERATGDLLTPSIWPTVKKRLQYVGSYTGTTTNSKDLAAMPKALHYALIAWKFTWNILLQIGAALLIAIKFLYQWIKKLIQNRDSLSGSGISGWWKSLTGPRKLFLGLFSLVVVIFFISIFTKQSSVKKDDQSTKYASTITQVQTLLADVETKQIMKDEAGARANIAQADQLLTSIPTDSTAYKNGGADLRTKINTYNQTFNKVTTLDQVTTAADFSQLTNGGNLSHIAKIGNNIFGFAAGSTAVYRQNLDNNTSEIVITGTGNAGYGAVHNDSVGTSLAVQAPNSFVQLNPISKKTSSVTAAFKDNDTVVTDFNIFANRLYVLDAKNNRIVRLDKSTDKNANGYAKPQAWLTDGTDLSKAVSFAIDSSIYVLSSDGAIIKLDGGKKSQFTADSTFTPSLAGATTIVKTDSANPFYILNPTTKRIVVLEPNGKLRAQYTNDTLAGATDMVVDEAAGVAYVLAGDKVYSINVK